MTNFCKYPESYKRINIEVLSNFDDKIDNKIVERLKNESVLADWPACNFFGTVWYDKRKKKFAVYVEVYGQHHGTYFASTMEELQNNINNVLGWD